MSDPAVAIHDVPTLEANSRNTGNIHDTFSRDEKTATTPEFDANREDDIDYKGIHEKENNNASDHDLELKAEGEDVAEDPSLADIPALVRELVDFEDDPTLSTLTFRYGSTDFVSSLDF